MGGIHDTPLIKNRRTQDAGGNKPEICKIINVNCHPKTASYDSRQHLRAEGWAGQKTASDCLPEQALENHVKDFTARPSPVRT